MNRSSWEFQQKARTQKHHSLNPFVKPNKMTNAFKVLVTLLCTYHFSIAQQPNPPGQVAAGEKPVNEAYLFAHMTHQDYGSLYYSVSLDGLHWHRLKNGKRVFEEYHGHPDIVKGPDGKY